MCEGVQVFHWLQCILPTDQLSFNFSDWLANHKEREAWRRNLGWQGQTAAIFECSPYKEKTRMTQICRGKFASFTPAILRHFPTKLSLYGLQRSLSCASPVYLAPRIYRERGIIKSAVDDLTFAIKALGIGLINLELVCCKSVFST